MIVIVYCKEQGTALVRSEEFIHKEMKLEDATLSSTAYIHSVTGRENGNLEPITISMPVQQTILFEI